MRYYYRQPSCAQRHENMNTLYLHYQNLQYFFFVPANVLF